jgi:hypothetical protein
MLDSFFDTSAEGKMARKLGIKRKDLQKLFDEFDSDGSGGIDSIELQSFVASLGLFWDSDKVEDALTAMDADGNGTVDLGEFATWFCNLDNFGDESGGALLKAKLQMRLATREFVKQLKAAGAAQEGKPCKNKFSFSVGDVDTEKSSGLLRAFFNPSSSTKFSEYGIPEGAKNLSYVDFFLMDGAADSDIEQIKSGAQWGFETFLEPMLEDMIPQPPQVPGMNEGKPFHSYEIKKVDDKLRVIAYSGIDVASIWREAGLEAGDFMPHLHAALYFGSPLSFTNPESGVAIKDLFNVKLDLEFSWNTKMLHLARAAAGTKFFQQFMLSDAPGGSGDIVKFRQAMVNAATSFFKTQNTSVAFEFGGFQEMAEAGALDFGLPYLQFISEEQERTSATPGTLSPFTGWGLTPLSRRPTDAETMALIQAIGSISGKTIATIRNEILTAGSVFPFMAPDGDGNMQPVDALFPAKWALTQVPEEMEPAREAGLAAYRILRGFAGVCTANETAETGVDIRGLNWGHLLPSLDDIEAAKGEDSACEDPQEMVLQHVLAKDKIHPLVKFGAVKFVAAAEDGLVPEVPEQLLESLKVHEINAEEMAKYKESLSEVYDIIRAVLPLAEAIDVKYLGTFPVPPEMASKALEFGIGAAKELVD